MKIVIDDDFADRLVQCALMDTYLDLKGHLKSKKAFHPDDVKTWKKTIAAIEELGNWYFANFKKELKQYEKDRI